MKERKWSRRLLIVLVWSGLAIGASAQNLLGRHISIEVKGQRLDHVLEILSNKGNFYFSYNSNIIRKDSLISLSAINKSVRQILDQLLPDHYEFRESGNYIIIRKTPITITMTTSKAVAEDKFYVVSGYVLDNETANWIRYASIYEKSMLAAALSNQDGYFRLKLKQKNRRAALTVSKEFYMDTTVSVDPGYNQQITVTLVPASSGAMTIIGPDDYFAPEQLKLRIQKDSTVTEYTYSKTDSIRVEKTKMGGFLISPWQKFQSLNLRRFIATRPYQVSFTPGLGTHGKLSPQVINNFSLNLLGGYNGGVNGVEIGGLFNIDKKSVQYFQVGGLFNIVGGHVKGLQVGGINNTVLDTVQGMQVGGVSNIVKGKFSGFQLGGVYNHVADSVKGLQVGGVANFARRKVSGSQIAGVINVASKDITGVQVAGVINYTRHLKGVQVGLINISDTSEGLSIGLINIVLKGYHKLSFSADEIVNANVAFKTGSRKLYNILHAGMNFSDSNEVFTFGYGLGTELRMGRTLSLNPELSAQHLYLGSWDFANILSKARLNLSVRLSRHVSLFAGPVMNVYYSNQDAFFKGYRSVVPPSGYKTYDFGDKVTGWIGWNAGINFF
ncbi:MAG TPA: hypothetical protein VFR58_14780 [Flavisolibacter sp.]|nr:hypothetical protein [Flavisolibacter sp.]